MSKICLSHWPFDSEINRQRWYILWDDSFYSRFFFSLLVFQIQIVNFKMRLCKWYIYKWMLLVCFFFSTGCSTWYKTAYNTYILHFWYSTVWWFYGWNVFSKCDHTCAYVWERERASKTMNYMCSYMVWMLICPSYRTGLFNFFIRLFFFFIFVKYTIDMCSQFIVISYTISSVFSKIITIVVICEMLSHFLEYIMLVNF